MSASVQYLNPADAANRLGVSAKALRLYEQRGLILPHRTAAGWRAYGPEQMARAKEIVALRALGLSLSQVARVLAGDPQGLATALAAHQASLELQARQLAGQIDGVRELRAGLARGKSPSAAELAQLLVRSNALHVGFDLPWPWGGERFELSHIRPLTYIIGPLGSGKTRLAKALAAHLPGAAFLGLERLDGSAEALQLQLAADPEVNTTVDRMLAAILEDGGETSPALLALLAGLAAENPVAIVVDMVEQGLGQATQEALIAHLRQRGAGARPLLLMTRSSAILDLSAVGADEAILFCPANHSPPSIVAPYPGAQGYEGVATCLASPEVRARIASPPQVA